MKINVQDMKRSLDETKETARPVRRRGRPRQKPEDVVHPEKLVDKIAAAVAGNDGKPTVYASTTKGGMKLFYSGHHFKYSFRKGQYSIFQCCYKENNEQCKVRVVSNQKRVFPLDGEHVHFIQATDKSVTSVMIGAADSQDEQSEQPPPQQQQHYITDDTVLVDLESTVETEAALEQNEPQHQPEVEQCLVKDDANISAESQLNANDFREKIKKRLQKALLGKKK